MAHTTSGLAHRLARWSVQATIVGLAACGGGGGSDASRAPSADLQAKASQPTRLACIAAPGFTAQDAFVVDSLGAGSQQQVRFAGPLQDGGFAMAWLSRMPTDTLPSWRLQWQRFDATGSPVGPPADLPYTEDAAPQNVAVLVQPTGRIIVAYAVTRVFDVNPPSVPAVNAVLARIYQDGVALPGEITIAAQTVDLRSFPGLYERPVLVGFDDGSFLAGWHIPGGRGPGVTPQLQVQQFTAGGTPVGDVVKIDALGGVAPPHDQLLTLPGGGWIAVTAWRTTAPGAYTLLTQVGVHHPLRTPDIYGVPGALPAGSVLLQDARGLLVASAPTQPGGAMSLQQFNSAGHAAGQPASLALTPMGATSLSTGEAALLATAGGTITLQRIDSRGDPVGQPLATSAPSDALAGALPGGGLVLTWVHTDAGGSQLMAQLFTPSCSG